MASVMDVLLYLCGKAPKEHTMPVTRLMRLAYLADWKSAIDLRRTLTETKWEFGAWGPWSKEVHDILHEAQAFEIESTETVYGEPKEIVKIAEQHQALNLQPEETSVLDFVIDSANRPFSELTRLVYSTFPLMVQEKGEVLDLTQLAERYLQRPRPHPG